MPLLEFPALYVDRVLDILVAPRPALINRDPGPDETGVPVGSAIALELVDTGLDGIDRQATRVWIAGTLAFGSNIQAAFAGPRASVTETSDTLRLVLDPVVPWASLATVTVRVASATKASGVPIDQTYAFTVEDRTAPRLVAAQALSQTLARLAFDEPVTILAPTGFIFTAQAVPAVPLTAVSAEAQGTLVAITLATEMTPDVAYRVVAAGVTDASGNAILPPYDTTVFAGFRPARPASRRFDLWSMLPKNNRRADTTGDLQRFIACLQEVTDLVLADIDRFSDLFDLERAPPAFLDLILRDLGNPFPFVLDELGSRRLASVLVEMYQQKGTAVGIENAIRFFLGVEVLAISPFAGTALVLGESEIGVDWELGPSDRHARYSFDLQVGVPLTPTERAQIRALVDTLKPAHTHFIDLLEPVPPVVVDNWDLGLSELGVTTLLH